MYSNEIKNLIRKIDLEEQSGINDLITAIEEVERLVYDMHLGGTLSDTNSAIMCNASDSLCEALKVLAKVRKQ